MKKRIFSLLCWTYSIICFCFAFLSWRFLCYAEPNWITFIFFFTAIGFSLLPFVDKLRLFGGLIEIERIKQELEEVRITILMREVVSDKVGNKFFVDEEGRHLLPDEETASFLKSSKGFLTETQQVLLRVPLAAHFESVKSAPLKIWDNKHVFVILHSKRYYVSSWSYLSEWNRSTPEPISIEELQRFPMGR
jgi:hypothetical protein